MANENIKHISLPVQVIKLDEKVSEKELLDFFDSTEWELSHWDSLDEDGIPFGVAVRAYARMILMEGYYLIRTKDSVWNVSEYELENIWGIESAEL